MLNVKIVLHRIIFCSTYRQNTHSQRRPKQPTMMSGSARFPSPETASASLAAAEANLAKIKAAPVDAAALADAQNARAIAVRHTRNAFYYDQARLFARLQLTKRSEWLDGCIPCATSPRRSAAHVPPCRARTRQNAVVPETSVNPRHRRRSSRRGAVRSFSD